jgi:uncharacterized membrane protein YgcG
LNKFQTVRDLIDLRADVNAVMGEHTTALTLAITNPKLDGTEMVRLLLSKSATTTGLAAAKIDVDKLNVTMQHWLAKAMKTPPLSKEDLEHRAKLPPMHKMCELKYALVGQEVALNKFEMAMCTWFGTRRGFNGTELLAKPMVMLMTGLPGHGKTYLCRNAASSLVGEDNFLYYHCEAVKSEADLFGARTFGRGNGALLEWLKARQGKDCVVFLDEFHQIKNLVDGGGHGQDTKIFKKFLSPWESGLLTDNSAATDSGSTENKIDVSRVVWVLTANWGIKEIMDFSEMHREKIYSKVDSDDTAWIDKELVEATLVPHVIKELKWSQVEALGRRITFTIPFIPFTVDEQLIVADAALRAEFQEYRNPAVLPDGAPSEARQSHTNGRLYGNCNLLATMQFLEHAVSKYTENEGASSMSRVAEQVNGQFVQQMLTNKLQISVDEKRRIQNDQPPPKKGEEGFVAEPVFWAHWDETEGATKILRVKPDEPKRKGNEKAPAGVGRGGGSSGGGGDGGGGGGGGVRQQQFTEASNPFN